MYQPTFTQTTHKVLVRVKPRYMEEESRPGAQKHIFAYFIKIKNLGPHSVKLLERYWKIEDHSGASHEVQGKGVIGNQPVIEPHSEYDYNSFCMLKSYMGSMKGYYTMQRQDHSKIKVGIPKFLLTSHLLN